MATAMPRLQKMYQDAVGQLKTELAIPNVMMVPRLEKIVVNVGQGDAVTNIKNLEGAVRDLELITGQKPEMTRAKNSIAGFRLRAGMPIGARVTLRGVRMYEFLDRMINVACPRIRDFRGFSPKAFDGNGNYSLGFREQIVFPEIDYDKVDQVRGIGISLVSTARSNVEGRALLDVFHFPFRK